MNDVEAAVHLITTAPFYSTIFKDDIEHALQQVLPPIKLNQYRVFRRGDRPFAYTSWAFINEDSSNKFKKTCIVEKENWWNNGKEIWVMDTISKENKNIALHRWTQRKLGEEVGNNKKFNWLRLGHDKFGEIKVKKTGYAFTKGEINNEFGS